MSTANTYIISQNSKARVYHRANCRFAKAMPVRYMRELSKHIAEKKGYRPCKCCNSMKNRFDEERQALERYAARKNLGLYRQSKLLYIRTPVGLWKICYAAKQQNFILYHGNCPYQELSPKQMKTACFHRQTDVMTSATILRYLEYIYKHDDYRQRVAQAGGNEKKVTISKKYAQQRERRLRREARRRLDDIFADIERKNPEYAKLAFR